MSATATQTGMRAFLSNFISKMCENYIGDLKHIPADKLGECPMGVARPPLEFTAECAGFNKFVAGVLRGEAPAIPDEEKRKAFYASINSFEKAEEALRGSVAQLVAALGEAEEADLEKEVVAPWGMQTTVGQIAHMAGIHMAYHDGQINYIQSLYGDGDMHWGEH